ncbi:hypothetical protein C2S53_009110 [Perilla frutescens var. hirtella]|uniref:Uncharacterized protein n=1 Tax=Perilla frutescens var. hirtella TaxID=608512 RepID=A0AAD4JD83_PERFH|nr:hypothetical protein C2S53_009110 [Perilla frutescens var. hirtella]
MSPIATRCTSSSTSSQSQTLSSTATIVSIGTPRSSLDVPPTPSSSASEQDPGRRHSKPKCKCVAAVIDLKSGIRGMAKHLVCEVTFVASWEGSSGGCGVGDLNTIFVKKLISLAIERKNREKDTTYVLHFSLFLPSDDVVNGFIMLIESVEVMALYISIVVEDLAMFIS